MDKQEESNNTLQVLKQTELLGQQFTVYGTAENPLFLAKDVAEMIDYSKTSQGHYQVSAMLSCVDEEEKFTINIINSNGKASNKLFLTEDGLYEVLMQSRKPIAKKFKRGVKEILKEIRKTGGYLATTPEDSPELIMARALQLANVTIERYKQQAQLSESTIEAQQEQIKELEPLADYTKNVLQSTETYTMTQVAKEFGYSAITFAKKLKDAGVLFQQSGTYMLKSKYQSKGYTKTRTAYFTHNNGTMGSKTSLVWTELGRQFLYALREGRIDSNGNIK